MLDNVTKSKLEKFIDKINVEDGRIYSVEIAFDEHFIYLQIELFDEGIQHVLQISDFTNNFINGRYNMDIVYAEITDAILKIIEREYSIRLARLLDNEWKYNKGKYTFARYE